MEDLKQHDIRAQVDISGLWKVTCFRFLLFPGRSPEAPPEESRDEPGLAGVDERALSHSRRAEHLHLDLVHAAIARDQLLDEVLAHVGLKPQK